MSRALSSALIAALSAHSTGERILALLTLVSASFGTLRLVANQQDLVSRGNTYSAHPFTGELPADLAAAGQGTFMLDATDRDFAAALRGATTPIDVTLEAVRFATPDTVEASAVFQVRAMDYDDETGSMQLDCAHEPVQDEPFPGPTYDPQKTPDLFVEAE